jgi:O6-methylguanine-DNA--protein-cysteine methyltransferase
VQTSERIKVLTTNHTDGNAAALFVPCHRIVRADRGMGGFRWGVEIKRRLLEHESGDALSRAPAPVR